MIKPEKIQPIALEVIKVLKKRFDTFPEDELNNRNAPFHEAFLKAFSSRLDQKNINTTFFISLASWLHGLNTTLGQSFFESVAHILSDGEKRTFRRYKISESKMRAISDIITELKNGTREPNLLDENEKIFSFLEGNEVDAQDFTADNIVITEEFVEAIEIKSVRPNAGEMRGEKQKILNAKAVLKNLYPDREIRFFIGFPFDPLSKEPTGYDKKRFMESLIEFNKYFHPDEVLLASEMWDRLSGTTQTMETILEIINDIATLDFMEKFTFIKEPNNFNRDKEKYFEILKKWHIEDEIKIFKKEEVFRENRDKVRIFNQQLFGDDGSYNERRKKLIEYFKK